MTKIVAGITKSEDRIPLVQKVIYGSGAFVNNLLAGAIGGMMIILNLGLGMDPALVGLLGALPRFFDAFTDPLMGYISDNTKSRWGRRRPYIFVGAILVGFAFMVLWQLPIGKSESFYFWYFLAGSLVFYLFYTIFATPWVALGYEMTPDYNERTRLMGTQFFIGQLAYFIPPWILLITQNERLFTDMVDGASGVAIVIGVFAIVAGVLPAIFLRERQIKGSPSEFIDDAGKPLATKISKMGRVTDFFQGFGTTLRFVPFLKLCVATFIVFNGFIMIAAFQTYVLIYYVFAGDQVAGAKYAGYVGTITTFATFGVIAFVTWLATKIGKRKAFAVSTGLAIAGYLLKWICYNPDIPWLILIPAPLIAFGLGGLFTVMPSMVADVVDWDELKTHQRREGMFGSIYWWVVKLGMAAALAGGGILLNLTGFDVALEGNQTEQTLFLLRVFDCFLPALAYLLAIWSVATYGLSQTKALEIREELEHRRGKAGPVTV